VAGTSLGPEDRRDPRLVTCVRLIRLGRIRLIEGSSKYQTSQMLHPEGTTDTKVSADRLSYDIVGAAIQVHRELGPGLLESAYETCLCRELSLRGIGYQQQIALPVHYRGMAVDCGYRIDLIVGHLVVVEVKAVAKVLPIHRAQVLTYLKLLRLHLGMIINFNVEVLRLGIYRIVTG
jgi:GxxExxY protein